MGSDVTQGRLQAEIEAALGSGAVVVTANERAARTLRRGYDEAQRASGAGRWMPAPVMSWRAWTGSLWRKLLIDGSAGALLLNATQEHAVWREVIAADEASGGLRSLEGLAEMAAGAWASLCAYAGTERLRRGAARGISGLLTSQDASTDAAAFARWAGAFEERCRSEALLPEASLDRSLTEAVRAGRLRLDASRIVLVGFDQMTPLQGHLIEALRSTGVIASHVSGEVDGARRRLTSAADEASELRACARWVRTSLEREPGSRVAIIVPDVAAERAGMERVFRQILAPELQSIAADESRSPYEFSLGRPLSETPLVSVALELLRWCAGALPVERVSALMVSGYFAGWDAEQAVRAEFDVFELRRSGLLRPEVTVAGAARRLAGSRRAGRMTRVVGALRRMGRAAAEFEGLSETYSGWAQRMRDLLAGGAGWSAPNGETSEEFQIRERWEGALDLMSTLDFEGRRVEFADALRAIERIARMTVFAPESKSAPVQVMGPMEAAGSEFDALWFLRAGEMSWPPAVALQPLLGWGLQLELKLPGTDAARDREMAQRVTERVLASGRDVVVSYARISAEMRQRASSIVRGIGLDEVAIEELAAAEPERLRVPTEWVDDAAQIQPLPNEVVSGGVRVLELQAACGFRAFAEQRLGSNELLTQGLGMNAGESGTAVHEALQSFWTGVRSQAALLAMNAEEREAALARAIEEGLRRAQAMGSGPWEDAYLDVQRERLRRLLAGWLAVETERPPFEVAQWEEEMRDVQVGPLRLRLRVDRVDMVDGQQVLIDYKTGPARPSEWLGDRPDAPQVPLYAIVAARRSSEVAGETSLGAVAFGNVRAGREARLQGFAAREGLLPGRLSRIEAGSFEAQINEWREVLEALANEFAAGDARVRPKNYPLTCERCGQRMLCRLDASTPEEMDDDEAREGLGG